MFACTVLIEWNLTNFDVSIGLIQFRRKKFHLHFSKPFPPSLCWLHWRSSWMCWPQHFGTRLPLSLPWAAITGWDRTGVSWRRWPVEYLPTLSFSLGPSVGPPYVLCPARAPARGESRAGRARYPARPLLCRRSLISVLHTAHWAHPFPGVLGPGGGGGGGVDMLYIGVFPNLPLLSHALLCMGLLLFLIFFNSLS